MFLYSGIHLLTGLKYLCMIQLYPFHTLHNIPLIVVDCLTVPHYIVNSVTVYKRTEWMARITDMEMMRNAYKIFVW